jgi:acyl-CoA thioesterase-1
MPLLKQITSWPMFVITGLIALAGMAQFVSADRAAVRIMPLGDSITQGYSASYRRSLWLALREAGKKVDFVGTMDSHYAGGPGPGDYDVDHEGHWGWTADEVLARIGDWVARSDPDIVLLHLGTNDIGGGQDPGGTVKEIAGIIIRIRAHNPGIHVLLASIIPVDHEAANARVRQFNAALGELVQSLDSGSSRVLLVDQFEGFDAGLDTYDGLHPNAGGIQKMTAKWLPALASLLNQ